MLDSLVFKTAKKMRQVNDAYDCLRAERMNSAFKGIQAWVKQISNVSFMFFA